MERRRSKKGLDCSYKGRHTLCPPPPPRPAHFMNTPPAPYPHRCSHPQAWPEAMKINANASCRSTRFVVELGAYWSAAVYPQVLTCVFAMVIGLQLSRNRGPEMHLFRWQSAIFRAVITKLGVTSIIDPMYN